MARLRALDQRDKCALLFPKSAFRLGVEYIY